ncbi:MAG TPA: hypothetical protein VJ875_11470 [Pyrinomonadaceae bacterium]|nr:hypothetical protein [Pyrinomonadaceae bacterium]
MDNLLLRLLNAQNEQEREQRLYELLTIHVAPILRKVLRQLVEDLILGLYEKEERVPSLIESSTQSASRQSYKSNTAFIMMWMGNTDHPDLEDVSNAIKEICGSFGIQAIRADDVEHQGRITELILRSIDESQYLIADLTGERPNVYYEIGYAQAIDKNPILFRKKGTKLHFDLAVHNVPEYRNITELKSLLRRRFEAILAQNAPEASDVNREA